MGVAWVALSWQYSGQITNLQSRLTLKDDQIFDYKEKLNGATPTEAKQRLDTLEAQVRGLTPRRLTEDQKQKIAAALKKGKRGVIEIQQDMAVADSRAYRGDFAQIFEGVGWQTILPGIMGPSISPPTGLAMEVANPGALSPAETLIQNALTSAGVEFDVIANTRLSSLPPDTGGRPTPDVLLLLTTRLK